jgi:hypothetical protein
VFSEKKNQELKTKNFNIKKTEVSLNFNKGDWSSEVLIELTTYLERLLHNKIQRPSTFPH